MQESLTAGSLFAHVLMQRQVDRRLFLVVEGDDEETIFFGHAKEADMTVLAAGGKPAVLGAGKLLDSERIRGALAFVDRDLDDLTGKSASYPPTVLATHGYDLTNDVVMTRPDLLRRALRAHGKHVVAEVERYAGLDILDVVFNLAQSLAVLRLVNSEQELGLNLRNFPFHEVLTEDYLPQNFTCLLRCANGRSSVNIKIEALTPHLSEALMRLNDDRKHSGGHDLMSAAAAVLRKGGAPRARAENIAASIYTAVSCDTVRSLPLFPGIQAWAARSSRSAFTC